jgi:transposase-like protein
MPYTPHPPEVKARVRRLVEETTATYEEIAAETRVSASSARWWARTEGWRRPDGAPTRKLFPREQRAAIMRLRAAGGSVHDIALGRNPEVVRRVGPCGAAGAAPRPEAAPAVPAAVEALCAALTGGPIGRDDLNGHMRQALACLVGELLPRQDLPADRKAQAIARAAAAASKLPDGPPARGASRDDDREGPATYAETNALLEEFAIRLAEFDAAEQAREALGEPVEADAAGELSGAASPCHDASTRPA